MWEIFSEIPNWTKQYYQNVICALFAKSVSSPSPSLYSSLSPNEYFTENVLMELEEAHVYLYDLGMKSTSIWNASRCPSDETATFILKVI